MTIKRVFNDYGWYAGYIRMVEKSGNLGLPIIKIIISSMFIY